MTEVIGTPEHPSERVWTIPNLLSMIRLALVPVFLVCLVSGLFLAAVIVLALASASDWFDGFLARKLHQVSTLGILLDPIADRLYIFAAIIGLAWQGFLPWWLVAIIIARDVLIVSLGLVLWRNGRMGKRGEPGRFRRGAIPVTWTGKTATFLLFFGLPLIMLSAAFPQLGAMPQQLGWLLTLTGTVAYWLAGVDYALRTRELVRNST